MLIIHFNPFSALRLERLEVQNFCRVRVKLFGISIDYCGKSIGIVADATEVEGLGVAQEQHRYNNTSFTGLYEYNCTLSLLTVINNKRENSIFEIYVYLGHI